MGYGSLPTCEWSTRDEHGATVQCAEVATQRMSRTVESFAGDDVRYELVCAWHVLPTSKRGWRLDNPTDEQLPVTRAEAASAPEHAYQGRL